MKINVNGMISKKKYLKNIIIIYNIIYIPPPPIQTQTNAINFYDTIACADRPALQTVTHMYLLTQNHS